MISNNNKNHNKIILVIFVIITISIFLLFLWKKTYIERFDDITISINNNRNTYNYYDPPLSMVTMSSAYNGSVDSNGVAVKYNKGDPRIGGDLADPSRLTSTTGWLRLDADNVNPYITYDFETQKTISGIATLGRYNWYFSQQYTKTYNIAYTSYDDNNFVFINATNTTNITGYNYVNGIKNTNDDTKFSFTGNSDSNNTTVLNIFDTDIIVRKIRIYPITYNIFPCMRIGFIIPASTGNTSLAILSPTQPATTRAPNNNNQQPNNQQPNNQQSNQQSNQQIISYISDIKTIVISSPVAGYIALSGVFVYDNNGNLLDMNRIGSVSQNNTYDQLVSSNSLNLVSLNIGTRTLDKVISETNNIANNFNNLILPPSSTTLTNTIDNVFNFNSADRSFSNYFTSTGPAPSNWTYIFNTPVNISAIELFTRNDCCFTRFNDVSITLNNSNNKLVSSSNYGIYDNTKDFMHKVFTIDDSEINSNIFNKMTTIATINQSNGQTTPYFKPNSKNSIYSNSIILDALNQSYAQINAERLNNLDNQDKINSLEERIKKLKLDIINSKKKNTNATQSLIFY